MRNFLIGLKKNVTSHISRINIKVFCLLLTFIFLNGCGNSEISLVKDAPCPLDKSMTLGKALDSYKYFSNSSWDVKKDDRGRRYVEFRALYANQHIVRDMTYDIVNKIKDFENYSTEFARYLDDNKFVLEFVAQFFITADGKNFEISYLGFDCAGFSEKTNKDGMENKFKRILKNDTLNYSTMWHEVHMPQEPIKYYFKKFVLKKIGTKQLALAATAMPAQVYLDDEHKPIAIYHLKNFIFDDKSFTITANVDYKISGITKASGNLQSNLNDKQALLVEVSNFINLHEILQQGTMVIPLRPDADYGYFQFYQDASSTQNGMFPFFVKTLNPVDITWHSIHVENFSDVVKTFVKTQKESLDAKAKTNR